MCGRLRQLHSRPGEAPSISHCAPPMRLITALPYAYDAFDEGHKATGDSDYPRVLESVREVRPRAREASEVLRRLLAEPTTGWARPDGHFVIRRPVIRTSAVPCHRWAQSQMFRALVNYRGPGS
jgi:hypothetical protein